MQIQCTRFLLQSQSSPESAGASRQAALEFGKDESTMNKLVVLSMFLFATNANASPSFDICNTRSDIAYKMVGQKHKGVPESYIIEAVKSRANSKELYMIEVDEPYLRNLARIIYGDEDTSASAMRKVVLEACLQ